MSDNCYNPQQDLISVEQALESLLAATATPNKVEQVHLSDALGRVLAQDIQSPLDVPSHDNSAMDGYALIASDITERKNSLPISQRIAAGHPGKPLQIGSCARIFTGAAIPENADTVVMQEQVENDGVQATFQYPIDKGSNIRPKANDLAKGDVVLSKGTRIQPQMLGLLASLGVAELPVYPRLKVALLNTGDEIVEPGQPLKAGQIYNSNRYSLLALLTQWGCDIIDLGQVSDAYEDTREAMLKAAQQADLIITSGGVSVGEEDHIKAVVQAEGELNLWRIRIKPGKPFAYGHVKQTPFIGLPGNPVSAFVTFLLLGRHVLLKMMGISDTQLIPQKVAIGFNWTKPMARREYVRVQLDYTTMPPQAKSFPRQGSDVLSSVAWADGLVEITEQQSFQQGDLLNYYSFSELLA